MLGGRGQLPHSLGCWKEKALLRSSPRGPSADTNSFGNGWGPLQTLVGWEADFHSTGMIDTGPMPKVTCPGSHTSSRENQGVTIFPIPSSGLSREHQGIHTPVCVSVSAFLSVLVREPVKPGPDS